MNRRGFVHQIKNHPKYMRMTLILLLTLFTALSAQDANYWTHHYGSRSTLLGGAVIGSVLDLSGTYYNPGAVSLVKDLETVLAAKVLEYPTYKLSGSLIDDIEMSDTNLGPAPSLVATNLDFDWLGDNNLVLSLLTRYDLHIDLNQSNTSFYDLENVRETITNIRVQERMSETWLGFTWSYNYKSRIGIGFTPYFVFRSHTTFIYSNLQTISPDDDHFHALESREYDYSHYSVLLKAGITFDLVGQTFGLTLTTPRLGYYTNGSSGANQTIEGKPPIQGTEDTEYVAANYQNDVDAKYKSPLSIALGTTFKVDRTNIYVSAEWFSPLEKYEVIQQQTYQPQIGTGTLYNGVVTEAKSVLNLGVGIQHTCDKLHTINASFTTDYSSRVSGSDTNLSIASWDIYHLMVGGSLNILDLELTLGFGYAFGKEQVKRDTKFSSDGSANTTTESFNGLSSSYQSFKLVFGIAV
jgi:hypothetical protein